MASQESIAWRLVDVGVVRVRNCHENLVHGAMLEYGVEMVRVERCWEKGGVSRGWPGMGGVASGVEAVGRGNGVIRHGAECRERWGM